LTSKLYEIIDHIRGCKGVDSASYLPVGTSKFFVWRGSLY